MIPVTLSFQGRSIPLEGITVETTKAELYQATLDALGLSSETSLKLLCKGKRIVDDSQTNDDDGDASSTSWASSLKIDSSTSLTKNKAIKIMVMATSQVVLADEATKRSDPTIRGFDQEKATPSIAMNHLPWGPNLSYQDKNFKFCRFKACTWHSFGHRPTDGTTPHAFQAMELLERLSTDPGIVAVMQERELVVGTLGEMDPIDDRLMQKKQSEQPGSCILGYNTNGGTRIDIKLRTDDLKGFRPYTELVTTLLHELSHNWVGEHNLLFWSNYGQMRSEYLTRHAALQSTIVNGHTTAEIATLSQQSLHHIADTILQELIPDMAQHGLHPRMIEAPIKQRCQELHEQWLQGKTLGSRTDDGGLEGKTLSTPRERALAAAEKRRQEQERQHMNQKES